MKAGCFSALGRGIVFLVFALLACGLISFVVSPVSAAENPAGSAFKDPYNGGIRLAEGGGDPGKAYMAFIDAAYRKDHAQLCKLIADPARMEPCLQQKEALDGYMAMFTQPKSHKVLGGFMKGDEATLNVAYTFEPASRSTGFVVMKQRKGNWSISSFGGSGSTNICVEASATVDLASGSTAASVSVGQSTEAEAASVRAGQSTEAEYTGPGPGKWTFEGQDDKGVLWTGTLMITDQYIDTAKYHDCSIEIKAEDGATNGIGEGGVGAGCKWNPSNREVFFGVQPTLTFTATLSADGKGMSQGTWTDAEEDWSTGKLTVRRTGVWTAVYASASVGLVNRDLDPHFALIGISPDKKEYTGKCPATITFTADITFKMPPPDKFSYRWEISDGRKTPDRVIKPPRNGHMSVKEVWRGGKAGEEHDASVRFVAQSGSSIILDPPAVKVICK